MEGGENTSEVFSLKETKLLDKVKRLLKRAKMPRFLHWMGPKKYELWHHLLALLIRELCRLSYRKTSALLRGLGFNCPSYSALCKVVKRVPRALWNALFNATAGFRSTFIAAFDGTYYSRSSPSAHYLKRTKKKIPKTPVQVNALFDTRRKKWIALRTRLKRVHETRDLEPLLKEAPPPIVKLVVDKVADDEDTHRNLEREHHIQPYIPIRKGVVNGMYRHKHAAFFHNKTYHRRSLIESGFGKNKRTQGGSVKNRLTRTIRTEITLRYINDNINLLAAILEIFNRAIAPYCP